MGVPIYPLLAGGLAALWGFKVLLERLLPRSWGEIASLLLPVLLFVGARLHARSKERAPALPEPAFATCRACRIGIDSNGRGFGRDDGYFVIVDGWLVFEGERLSFSIGSQDVAKSATDAGVVRLDLVGGPSLRFETLGDGPRADLALRSWAEGPAVAGLSRLPPQEPWASPDVQNAACLSFFGAFSLSISLVGLAQYVQRPSAFGLGFAVVWAVLSMVLALLARRLDRRR